MISMVDRSNSIYSQLSTTLPLIESSIDKKNINIPPTFVMYSTKDSCIYVRGNFGIPKEVNITNSIA